MPASLIVLDEAKTFKNVNGLHRAYNTHAHCMI